MELITKQKMTACVLTAVIGLALFEQARASRNETVDDSTASKIIGSDALCDLGVQSNPNSTGCAGVCNNNQNYMYGGTTKGSKLDSTASCGDCGGNYSGSKQCLDDPKEPEDPPGEEG